MKEIKSIFLSENWVKIVQKVWKSEIIHGDNESNGYPVVICNNKTVLTHLDYLVAYSTKTVKTAPVMKQAEGLRDS